LVAALLLQLAAAPSTTSEAAYSQWFKFGEEAAQAWNFSEVSGNSLQVTISRRRPTTETPSRRVFVLYPRASSAYDVAITKMLDVFDQKDINVEFTVVNFNNEQGRGQEALRQAQAGNYDLIFSMGSESTAWLYANYRGGTIPVVSVCSKDPVELGQVRDYDSGSGTNFAFTSLNMPIDVQMTYIMQLRPKLKNIGVLVDQKNVSAVQTQAEPIARYARRLGIQVVNVAVQDPDNAHEELPKLVSRAVAAMRKNDPDLSQSVFIVTGSTSVFREIAAINANSDRVPVISMVPEVVKAGDDSAVMSIGVSFESNAHLAAVYGADVLTRRARVGDLKVGVVSPPDIAINFRKAREIGLKIPFSFFERSSFVYDYDGRIVRNNGKAVAREN
jgi:putative ABC transport system substrate-binding protein